MVACAIAKFTIGLIKEREVISYVFGGGFGKVRWIDKWIVRKRKKTLTEAEPQRRHHPVQLVIDPDPVQHEAERRGDEPDRHGRQAHLGLADPAVARREEIRRHVGDVAAAEDADQSPDQPRDEAQPGLPRGEVVGRRERRGEVGRDGDEEADRHRHDQRRPEHRRQAEQDDGPQEDLEDRLARQDAVVQAQAADVGVFGGDAAVRAGFNVRDVVGLFNSFGGGRLVVELRGAVEVRGCRDGAPVERRLGHGEEDEDRRGADQSRGDVVDVSPGVADGDEACDDDASGDTAGEKCCVCSDVG